MPPPLEPELSPTRRIEALAATRQRIAHELEQPSHSLPFTAPAAALGFHRDVCDQKRADAHGREGTAKNGPDRQTFRNRHQSSNERAFRVVAESQPAYGENGA